MKKILVCGQINMETTMRVDGFPIKYTPVNYPFFGIRTTVAGVGLNIASGLKKLGQDPEILALIGRDREGENVLLDLDRRELKHKYVIPHIEETTCAIILYDKEGKRQANNDLKDVQETAYPEDLFTTAIQDADNVILCNINYSRPFLSKAKAAGKKLFTDVHTVNDIHDPYNSDFMKYADVLFLSNEKIKGKEKTFVKDIHNTYGNRIIVVGLGKEGALLFEAEAGKFSHVPAVKTREIVSTIGAGDALFSGFVDGHTRGMDPLTSLKRATVFASYKIGAAGAAEGFLDGDELKKILDEKSADLEDNMIYHQFLD